MADNQKIEKLQSLIIRIESATTEGSITNNMVAEALALLQELKLDAVTGKSLTDVNFTAELKAKLDGIAEKANNYEHPATHDPSIIAETPEKRFISQELIDKIMAIQQEPNLVGQFADDSTPDDWFWWPNGVKTPLEVDPATKRFSTYWPEVLKTTAYLFAGGSSAGAFSNNMLTRVERVPLAESYNYSMCNLRNCEVYPVLDCAQIAPVYNIYYTLTYAILNSSKRPRDIYLRNTEKITEFHMVLNNYPSDGTTSRVWGIDFSRAEAIKNRAFGICTSIIQGVNLGKRKELKTANLYSEQWGDDTKDSGSRQSVVDTLLTNSYDRVAAGYDPVTLQLSDTTVNALTDEEKAAITAKGYTITAFSTPPN